MPRLLFTSFFIVTLAFATTAQSPWRYSFGAGVLGCGRILSFKDTRLNATEKDQLQTLEVLKPGYMGSIGLEKQIGANARLGWSLGYQYSGFGSKTYTIPDSVNNTTPQYFSNRESYIIHRVFLAASWSHTVLSGKKSSLFIFGGLAAFYNPRFVRRQYAIGLDGSVGIITTTEKPLPEFPKFDVSLQVGAGYERKIGQNTALSIVPNLCYFLRSYYTRGDKVLEDYLFLKKKTTGHLYTFGLEVRFTKAITTPYYTTRHQPKPAIAPLVARPNDFSLSIGTNVAYLCSKQSRGGPGAYVNVILTKSKFQFGWSLSAYNVDKQDGFAELVSDLDHKFLLVTMQSRWTVGYNILNHSKISLAPLAGFVLDRRNINIADTYETEPGTDVLVGYTFREQTQYHTGGLLGLQSRLAISKHFSLDLWSHFQYFQRKNPTNLVNALFKGNVWLTGLGLAYHW